MTTFDPNSTVPHAHEVRVRARGVRITQDGKPVQVSTRSDFIAPDQSPLPTLVVEQMKGLRGWTAGKVDDRRSEGRKIHEARIAAEKKQQAADDLAAITITGTTVIRKVSTDRKVVVSRTGPRRNRRK